MWCTRIMMKWVYTPVAAHRRWLSKGVIDTVSWLSQSTDIFTKFNEANLQLQGNGVNLINAKSAIFTFLSKFNAVQTKSSPSWTLRVSKSLTSDGVSRLGLVLETCLETRFLESRSRRISVSVSSSSSRDFA